MGTRADFYIGRGEKAEWLGSVAWDGYPTGILPELLKSESENDYRTNLKEFFKERALYHAKALESVQSLTILTQSAHLSLGLERLIDKEIIKERYNNK